MKKDEEKFKLIFPKERTHIIRTDVQQHLLSKFSCFICRCISLSSRKYLIENNKIISCPDCSKKLEMENPYEEFSAEDREELKDIDLTCKYKQKGCQEIFNLRNLTSLLDHEEICRKNNKITKIKEKKKNRSKSSDSNDCIKSEENSSKNELVNINVSEKNNTKIFDYKSNVMIVCLLILCYMCCYLYTRINILEKELKYTQMMIEIKNSKEKTSELEKKDNLKIKRDKLEENDILLKIKDSNNNDYKDISFKNELINISNSSPKKSIYDQNQTAEFDYVIEQSSLFKEVINNSKFELIYNAKQHNFLSSKFHQYCDGKTNLITIIMTTEGLILGGYSPVGWSTINSNNGFIKDNTMKGFLFSYDHFTKLPHVYNPQKALVYNVNAGPIFGGGYDLYISDKCNMNENSYFNPGNTYDMGKIYYKKEYFSVLNYEIYQIINYN